MTSQFLLHIENRQDCIHKNTKDGQKKAEVQLQKTLLAMRRLYLKDQRYNFTNNSGDLFTTTEDLYERNQTTSCNRDKL